MKPVLLDTVGLLALWDKTDQWHAGALNAFDKLIQAKAPLVTTSYVFLECANAASRRPYRQDVADLRNHMESGGTLIQPTQDDWDRAWVEYSRGDADRAGVVDHVSFIVMRRMGIHQAFTNDSHFRVAGFDVLF